MRTTKMTRARMMTTTRRTRTRDTLPRGAVGVRRLPSAFFVLTAVRLCRWLAALALTAPALALHVVLLWGGMCFVCPVDEVSPSLHSPCPCETGRTAAFATMDADELEAYEEMYGTGGMGGMGGLFGDDDDDDDASEDSGDVTDLYLGAKVRHRASVWCTAFFF